MKVQISTSDDINVNFRFNLLKLQATQIVTIAKGREQTKRSTELRPN